MNFGERMKILTPPPSQKSPHLHLQKVPISKIEFGKKLKICNPPPHRMCVRFTICLLIPTYIVRSV